MPMPAGSMRSVDVFGAGPGSYFDLAPLSFQVPITGSRCASAAVEPAIKTTIRVGMKKVALRIAMVPPRGPIDRCPKDRRLPTEDCRLASHYPTPAQRTHFGSRPFGRCLLHHL